MPPSWRLDQKDPVVLAVVSTSTLGKVLTDDEYLLRIKASSVQQTKYI
jgi:hypothetical protein